MCGVSIVVPVFNERENLEKLVEARSMTWGSSGKTGFCRSTGIIERSSRGRRGIEVGFFRTRPRERARARTPIPAIRVYQRSSVVLPDFHIRSEISESSTQKICQCVFQCFKLEFESGIVEKTRTNPRTTRDEIGSRPQDKAQKRAGNVEQARASDYTCQRFGKFRVDHWIGGHAIHRRFQVLFFHGK